MQKAVQENDMEKYLALKYEENFVPIQDGTSLYYGGDQAWYTTRIRRHSACGTVAATNIAIYEGLYRFFKAGGEFPGQHDKLKQFLLCMNEMYNYINPLRIPFLSEDTPPFKGFGWSFGVWPAGRLIRGMKRFAKTAGIFLVSVTYRKNREAAEHFIETALLKNCPVALLIGTAMGLKDVSVYYPNGSSFIQSDFTRHWVTVTALERRKDGIYIKVSTWGGYAWLPLAGCFRTTLIKSRMCYFSWTAPPKR